MREDEIIHANNIFRNLYYTSKKNDMKNLNTIIIEEGLTQDQAIDAIRYLKSKGYIKLLTEDTYLLDITEEGFAFFSESDLISEHIKRNASPIMSITNNNFENIHNSKIYNHSNFTNAFNKIKKNNEDAALVLEQVRILIQESGNNDASILFDSFNEELGKAEPKKPILKSLWAGLTSILPNIEQSVDIFEKVKHYFLN